MFLRRKLRGRNIPIMYFGPDQRITMEDIEHHVLANVKDKERTKFLPKEQEQKELEEFHKQEEVLAKNREKQLQRKVASERGVELKFIKKNVAKGPNPLSIKLKRTKDNSEEAEAPEKKKRIRKRKNKGKEERQEEDNDN